MPYGLLGLLWGLLSGHSLLGLVWLAAMAVNRWLQAGAILTVLGDPERAYNALIYPVRDVLARLDIRAPVSGQVVDLQAFTKGGVIEPGRAILQIVPQNRTIVAVADIRPQDIANLHRGQAARIIATGFDQRDTQAIEGRVDVISADRLTDTRTGRSYYTAEISLLADHARGALLKQLGPGMPVEVVVPVKARTVLQYLMEPLWRSLRAAGREI